jgi:hypothetical protein
MGPDQVRVDITTNDNNSANQRTISPRSTPARRYCPTAAMSTSPPPDTTPTVERRQFTGGRNDERGPSRGLADVSESNPGRTETGTHPSRSHRPETRRATGGRVAAGQTTRALFLLEQMFDDGRAGMSTTAQTTARATALRPGRGTPWAIVAHQVHAQRRGHHCRACRRTALSIGHATALP